MRQGTRGWCTGMNLTDGMGREVGGGSGWRTHVHPWLIHVSVWQKPLQYCKVISLQLKQINKLKKKKGIDGTGCILQADEYTRKVERYINSFSSVG